MSGDKQSQKIHDARVSIFTCKVLRKRDSDRPLLNTITQCEEERWIPKLSLISEGPAEAGQINLFHRSRIELEECEISCEKVTSEKG
jgi:hypothetical protein